MGMQPWNQTIMATMPTSTTNQRKHLTAKFERGRSPDKWRLDIPARFFSIGVPCRSLMFSDSSLGTHAPRLEGKAQTRSAQRGIEVALVPLIGRRSRD